jgi:hypothetical protein
VNKELKVTTLTEMKFGPDGKLVATPIDAKTTVQAKPGVRGRMQQSAAEDNAEYMAKAADVMAQYAYMSKGQLVDFFDKATVTTDGKVITATAKNVMQAGDEMTILIDPATNLFIRKTFKAKSGADPIEGTVDYAAFATTGAISADRTGPVIAAVRTTRSAARKCRASALKPLFGPVVHLYSGERYFRRHNQDPCPNNNVSVTHHTCWVCCCLLPAAPLRKTPLKKRPKPPSPMATTAPCCPSVSRVPRPSPNWTRATPPRRPASR